MSTLTFVPTTTSAHDVAAAIRARIPDAGKVKLHKLLYYCQGHHLAAFGQPLFAETISAWDMGPVVPNLWKREQIDSPHNPPQQLTEGELNTIGYVLSRYGQLTGTDLIRLSHSEPPWIAADEIRQRTGKDSIPISHSTLRKFFVTDYEDDEPAIDAEQIEQFRTDARGRSDRPGTPDTREAILALAEA